MLIWGLSHTHFQEYIYHKMNGVITNMREQFWKVDFVIDLN